MINKNKEIRIHWDKIVFVIVMIGMAMFLSYSFYITHILDADSYGGIWNYYQNKNLGISSSNGISFKLYDILNLLMYSLFGIDEKLILGTFCAELIICYIYSMLLSRTNNKWTDYLEILIITYLFLPNGVSNEDHLIGCIACLSIIYEINKFITLNKPKHIWIAVLLSIYFVWSMTDRVILGIFLFIPLILYGLCYIWQKKKYKRQIFMSAIILCICVLIYRIAYIVLQKYGIVLPYDFSGYGGGDYATWSDITTVISKGIGSFLDGLRILWNIPASWSLIQFQSFNWCIRFFLLGWAIYINVGNLVTILRKGINEIPFLDAFCALCFLVTAGVNIINGASSQYESGELCRYAAILQFTLAITLVRKISNILNHNISNILNMGYSKTVMLLGIAVVCLIGSYSQEIYRGRDYFKNNTIITQIISTLKENGLEYGLGTFEKAMAVFGESDGEYKVVTTRFGNEDGLIQPGIMGDAADGSNYFNYLLIGNGDYFDYTYDKAKEEYGEPSKELHITNDSGWSAACVFVYDYDVRWKPEYFYCENNVFVQREIPMGVSRLSVHGTDIQDVQINNLNEKISCKFVASTDDTAIFELTNLGEKEITDIVLDTQGTVSFGIAERVYAAIEIEKDIQMQAKDSLDYIINNDCDEYRIVVHGNNVNALELSCDNQSVELQQINRGTERVVYYVSNPEHDSFNLKVTNLKNNPVYIRDISINEKEVIPQ